MSDKLAIKITDLSKKYLLNHDSGSGAASLGEKINSLIISPFSRSRQSTEIFWALKNISLEIEKGKKLGVVGGNGAGKSTLLKILSQITAPTQGSVGINGRVASLLEVGTGFHPELTGRENIFLNGAILGMTKKEIACEFDDIVDFSGVGKFLDTPVKRYSSGMYVRLAFAVAAHLRSEILLVDEVLAVGDMEFQKKCLEKLDESDSYGRTVIFVSHNMSSVARLCDDALVLKGGEIAYNGKVDGAISLYTGLELNESVGKVEYNFQSSLGFIRTAELIWEGDGRRYSYEYSESIEFVFDICLKMAMNSFVGVQIVNNNDQVVIFWRDFELDNNCVLRKEAGAYKYRVTIPSCALAPGCYKIVLALVDFDSQKAIHFPDECMSFDVVDTKSERAMRGMPWRSITGINLSISQEKIVVIA